MTRPVALTGATGFIGGNLRRSLLEAGIPLRLLTRRSPSSHESHPSVEWVQGDLSDRPALTHLVRGAASVIHIAGAVRGGSRESFQRVNVEGTRVLVEAAAEQDPPPRFLLLSSLAAREPRLSWYSASKRDAEETLREACGTMPWAVFRPTAVYGPGDKEMEPLFRSMRRGILPVLGSPRARFTLLHVEDLVRAIFLWIQRPEVVTGTYELHDGRPDGYDWQGVAEMASDVWGRSVHRIRIPRMALSSLAALNLLTARITGSSPMLTPGKVRELTHPDWRCDNAPLTSALGWEPRVDLRAALEGYQMVEPPTAVS
jgi:nucleoside-diphosphate-sugar epimerase